VFGHGIRIKTFRIEIRSRSWWSDADSDFVELEFCSIQVWDFVLVLVLVLVTFVPVNFAKCGIFPCCERLIYDPLILDFVGFLIVIFDLRS
jgi:hypothetical protein